MKRRRKGLHLIWVMLCALVLFGMNAYADRNISEVNLPTKMNFTFSTNKKIELGESIKANDFSVTCDNWGEWGIHERRFSESSALITSQTYTGGGILGQYEKTLKKDTYYAIVLVLVPPADLKISDDEYNTFKAQKFELSVNGKEMGYGAFHPTYPSGRAFSMSVFMSLTPEEIHPQHDWGEGVKEADGVWRRTCKNKACGEKEEHQHIWNAWTTIVSATADREEVQTRQCTSVLCGHESEERTIHSIHKYDSYKIVSEPTATTDGRKIGSCSVCKMTASFAIPHLVSDNVKVSASSFPMKKGKSFRVTVSDLVKTDYVAAWSTDTPNIVAVDSTGRITALKKGTGIIRMKLASGREMIIRVRVQTRDVKTTKLTGLPKKLTLFRKEKQTLKPVIAPITSEEKVTYQSSNKKVVTVSRKGVIKAKKKGKATITVRSGKITKKIKITVK